MDTVALGSRPAARTRPIGRWAALAGGAVALLATMVGAVLIGTARLSAADAIRTVLHHLGWGDPVLAPLQDGIVWQLRASRVAAAGAIGSSLAVAGCALQALTRNPLAEPYMLGTSSGASLGAIAVFVLGVGGGSVGVAGGAFVGAVLSFALVLTLLGTRSSDSVRIVLIGVLVGQFFSGAGSFILMFAGDAESVYGITHWLLGELSAVRWSSARLCVAVCVVGMAIIWLSSTSLDALALGPDAAASLGVRIRRTQLVVLTVSAAMIGTVVATAGAIGFVGLIVPHAVRFLGAVQHRWLLPFAALLGAIFLIWADVAARVAFDPQEIPVGVFTSLIGVPLFLAILKGRGQL